MIIVVPEDLLEETSSLTPEKVYAVKHLRQPSVITSGDLKVATETLDRIKSALKKTWSLFEEITPTVRVPEKTPYNWKYTTVTATTAPESVPPPPKEFIRYVRPVDDYGIIQSFGGVAVLINLDPENKSFKFSMSICGKGDLFNKKIAVSICKNRYEFGNYFEVINYDSNISVMSNIYTALRNHLHLNEFDGTFPSPTITRLPPKTKSNSLKKVIGLIEDYYSPVDWGSLFEIIKGK